MPATQTKTTAQINAADKRAARKASRDFVAAHNARIAAERAVAAAALAAHIAQWGEDGFECA